MVTPGEILPHTLRLSNNLSLLRAHFNTLFHRREPTGCSSWNSSSFALSQAIIHPKIVRNDLLARPRLHIVLTFDFPRSLRVGDRSHAVFLPCIYIHGKAKG